MPVPASNWQASFQNLLLFLLHLRNEMNSIKWPQTMKDEAAKMQAKNLYTHDL
jgi:hypothetical protein